MDSIFQHPDDILVKDAIFQDRISQLPDDILVNFLSKLEMKNAAQTSVVSKLWRYLWTWRTDLDFDPAILFPDHVTWYTFTNKGNQYLNWVNQVVNMHCGLHLNKFRVVFSCLSAHHSAHLDKWVKFAFSKQVQELVLELVYNDSFKFSLGFDILKHSPCNTGISALISLHLSCVGVSKDFLEYIFSRCHLLERLFACRLDVESLKIKAYKLKYLSLINCRNLKELEIDAINLMYFSYEEHHSEFLPRLVFSSVPKLVEACFAGDFCKCPYPILDHISYISEQLTKLSFSPQLDFRRIIDVGCSLEIAYFFPNIKHLTLTFKAYQWSCINYDTWFIEACPMLLELKLQIDWLEDNIWEEAPALQKIEFEEERKNKGSGSELLLETDRQFQDVQLVDVIKDENYNYPSHQHLRVLEIVGFRGCRADVDCALRIVDYAHSLETIICDPREFLRTETTLEFREYDEDTDIFRRLARKLARIVPPNVKVVIL